MIFPQPLFQKLKFLPLVLIAVLCPPMISATMVTADGFANSFDCGAGAQEVYGHHAAVLNFVTPSDFNKTWQLRGEVWRCGLTIPSRVTTPCVKQGSTNTSDYLQCTTQAVVKCNRVKNGVHSRETAGEVGGSSFYDEHESTCSSSIHCDGGVGPRRDPLPGEVVPRALKE
jgi:hypothetical protein